MKEKEPFRLYIKLENGDLVHYLVTGFGTEDSGKGATLVLWRKPREPEYSEDTELFRMFAPGIWATCYRE